VEANTQGTPTDVKIRVGGDQFKFRVSALLVHEGRMLTTSSRRADYCYLPGGKVQLGESAEAAMRRELLEELGHELPAGELVLVAEHLYEHEDASLRHELTFYFRIGVPSGLTAEDLTTRPEPDHELTWIPLDGLAGAGFRPAELIGELGALGTGTGDGALRHLVADRRA